MLSSSAFTALLNCAEVGRRNRILMNYRFLSHSLFYYLNNHWKVLFYAILEVQGADKLYKYLDVKKNSYQPPILLNHF